MKIPVLVCCLMLLPTLIVCQTSDPVLDSLSRPLPAGATVRKQAEQCQAVMWYIFINAIDKYEYWPERLDSLFHCCMEGKTNDALLEKTIDAEIDFYKGFKEMVSFQHRNAKSILGSALIKYAACEDSAKMAWTNLLLCKAAVAFGDSLSFSKHYEQANKLSVYIKIHKDLAVFHLDNGASCYAFGKLTEAASHFFKTLELIDQYGNLGHYATKSTAFGNLVNIFYDIGDFENGERYSRIAVQLAIDEQRDPSGYFVNLARCIKGKGGYKEALLLLKKVEQGEGFPRDDWEKGLVLTHQAECFRKLGDAETALKLMEQVVRLTPMTTDAWYRSYALWELAECEFALGAVDKALKHGIESYGEFKKLDNSRHQMYAAGLIANIYKTKRNYRKAFEYSELRYKHLQEVERQQSGQKMALGEFTRDNAAEKTRREAEVKAQLDQQRNIRYGLFAGLGVFALLAFLLFNRYRYKQRTNEQLEAKNIEVEAARRRAEASEAFKSRFLANMSHEIRTPLHGIAGFTDLVLETSLTEKQRRYLSSIHHSTERLTEVVNDILDISKLEAGEVQLRQVPFSPARIAHDVQESLSVRAENKGIELNLHIGEGVPEAVLGDPTRLYQILMNLAGNAVKFTEKGEVRLTVNGERQVVEDSPAHARTTLTFSLADTGIGIPPEKLATIFDSFQQANDDTTARFGGTGLGLTIARELVQLHGSDIRVGSAVGKGSTFSFALNLPLANAADLEKTGGGSGDLYFTQTLKILLADDNAFNREIATEALLRHFENVEIVEAVNGKKAVEQLEQQGFDLVLMDMQMPEMNGIEATQHIRQHFSEGKRDVPIIALTASATPEEIEKALASGMNRHLGKPFKPHDLAQAIAQTLQLHSSAEKPESAGKVHPGPAERNGEDAFDLAFLRDFCGGDEMQVEHFLQKFKMQCPLEIECLEAAFQLQDREAIYQAAHSFRPQLEFVGLTGAAHLAATLEQGARNGRVFGELGDLLKQLKRMVIF